MVGLTAFGIPTGASAHTPQITADCTGITVAGTDYDPNQANTWFITLEGAEKSGTFGATLSERVDVPQDRRTYTWAAQVRDPAGEFNATRYGTVGPCGEEPPVLPPVEPPVEEPPVEEPPTEEPPTEEPPVEEPPTEEPPTEEPPTEEPPVEEPPTEQPPVEEPPAEEPPVVVPPTEPPVTEEPPVVVPPVEPPVVEEPPAVVPPVAVVTPEVPITPIAPEPVIQERTLAATGPVDGWLIPFAAALTLLGGLTIALRRIWGNRA